MLNKIHQDQTVWLQSVKQPFPEKYTDISQKVVSKAQSEKELELMRLHEMDNVV